MRWPTRIVLILVLALATSACGVRLAYNNLDWLIMRWVNKQITLSAEQTLAVRDALDAKLDWHCASELPDYVAFLERFDADLASERLDAEALERHGRTVSEFGQRLVAHSMPTIVDLFASLDDEQVGELLAGIDQRNRELIEDEIVVEAAVRRQNQIDSLVRGIERFAGSVNEAQRERLTAWAESLRFSAPHALAHRLQWRAELAEILELRGQRPRFDERLSSLLEPGAGWSAEYTELMNHNRARTLEALADVHALSSPRQKREFRERITDLADDFERLSCG
ncbi:DUF6279 family lipoprotein [Wenzhouxiangella marina]|uniref:Uncharacterized protein n=1 Tax=Wenzhouxiangella marina TaxID=1579979 RepID=A0A0K0XZM6_9GAMM|nr:DUF6279 family lipoprotein [Wenzhouxiangella marina]AKS43092.1 hypothetical protein WM2015_2734 [Wenzhouxiangella marina]MBB6087224.1 hypothetical protein [Wenzhouxiangella marina]